ncbi:MAG: sigma-70 family RNA polymerase sigma factor [Anaerolineae bacterium]|nr:sigma-70 family RNA polymerase sigma factor [Anaerolineae bacterium]
MNADGNEEYLAQCAQQGDREAFMKLYDLYIDKVYNRVKSKVPASYVEDVTQEVFIAVLRSLHRFEYRSRFSTWLYTIVNRQIADFYRQRNRASDAPEVSLDHVDYFLSDSAFSEHGEERALVQKAFNTLPDHYQEIILLRFADGLTFAEIAEQREQSLEATKSLYRRAIQALRDEMGV